MCNCINDLTDKLNSKYDTWEGKAVKESEPQNCGISLTTGKQYAAMGFNVHVQGQKKPKKTSVAFNFCPFCGTEM